jgi:invasion protein IalB
MGDTIVGRAARLAFALSASVWASHSMAEEQALFHSPWAKFCGKENREGAKEMCLTVREARQPGGLLVAVVILIEIEGETRKVLRMTLPSGVAREMRVMPDQHEPVGGGYVVCVQRYCTADADVDADFVSRLKAGTTLSVSSSDASGRTVTQAFPLAGFAAAYDGPPTDPKEFEVETKRLSEELQKKADERRKMLERSAPAVPAR